MGCFTSPDVHVSLLEPDGLFPVPVQEGTKFVGAGLPGFSTSGT